VLDLCDPAALELLHVSILRESYGIPEPGRGLHTELVLEGSQGRVRVETPVAPCGPRKSILVEHADDGHHGQAAICQLSVQLPGLGRRVLRRERLEAEVALRTRSAGGLVR